MQERTIDVNGLTVHLREDGDQSAPPLLLLHSLGTSAEVWTPIVAALAPQFRVLRPDMRGHGSTPATTGPYTIPQLAQDVLALLDALKLDRVALVGLSIGGLIAQQIAATAPTRIAALILMDTALKIPPATLWHERAALVRDKGMAAVVDPVIARWLTPTASPHAAEPLRKLLLATPPEGYAASAEAIAAADLSEQSPGIACPTLVLVGDSDQATPVASAEALLDAIPGARLEIIAQAAHIPTAEQPAAIAAALLRFLASSGFDAGMRTRRAVLGDAHVDRSMANATDFDRDFQRWITAEAWGGVWSRPHFDRRTRSIITLALLAGLGREEEFKLHLRATSNTGATQQDVAEMLFHVAVYAGVPAANSAMRMAREIYAEKAS